MRMKPSLTLDDAERMLAAGLAEARSRKVEISVAVTDEAGVLIAMARMDGARGYTVDLALRRARVAAQVGAPTSLVARMQSPGQGEPVAAGGAPAAHLGVCAGGVGVSGAKPEIDEAIALAAAGLAADRGSASPSD